MSRFHQAGNWTLFNVGKWRLLRERSADLSSWPHTIRAGDHGNTFIAREVDHHQRHDIYIHTYNLRQNKGKSRSSWKYLRLRVEITEKPNFDEWDFLFLGGPRLVLSGLTAIYERMIPAELIDNMWECQNFTQATSIGFSVITNNWLLYTGKVCWKKHACWCVDFSILPRLSTAGRSDGNTHTKKREN